MNITEKTCLKMFANRNYEKVIRYTMELYRFCFVSMWPIYEGKTLFSFQSSKDFADLELLYFFIFCC